jgi:hypothetical protein
MLAMGFGCTHEGGGWETPSSASSAPPQPNDDEISEKERNPNGAPMASLGDSGMSRLGTGDLMPDVPLANGELGEDGSVEAMDASHFACSLTKLNLSSGPSSGNGGRLDKIWGVSAKLSGKP